MTKWLVCVCVWAAHSCSLHCDDTNNAHTYTNKMSVRRRAASQKRGIKKETWTVWLLYLFISRLKITPTISAVSCLAPSPRWSVCVCVCVWEIVGDHLKWNHFGPDLYMEGCRACGARQLSLTPGALALPALSFHARDLRVWISHRPRATQLSYRAGQHESNTQSCIKNPLKRPPPPLPSPEGPGGGIPVSCL